MRRRTTRMMQAAITVALVAAGAAVRAQQGSTPADVAMGAALHAEEVEGDLQAAISGFARVIADPRASRSLVASALLHLGHAYEKLGHAQARASYERVAREFADQRTVAEQARVRLEAMPAQRAVTTGPAAPADDRVVRRGPNITWGDGRVSPDGRYVSYTDWNFTGNLMLHDLSTGTDRAVTANRDFNTGNASTSVFSPDGRQLAYGWRTYRPVPVEVVAANTPAANANDLRIVMLSDGAAALPRQVCANEDVSYYLPHDWSRDGASLAVAIERRDLAAQLAVVGVADCSIRVLKTVGWRKPKHMFFSPDAKFLAYDLPASDTDAQSDIVVTATDGSREGLIAQHAAHEQLMGWSPDGRWLLFTSDRAGSVGLWQVAMRDGRAAGAPSLVRPDVGAAISQGLTSEGALLTVKDSSTLALQIAPIDLAAGRLTGPAALESFQADRPDWSRDGRRLAYPARTASGLPMLVVRSTATGERKEVRVPMLYIQEPRWLADGRTLITAGRDFKGRGVLYRIDTESGQASYVADAAAVDRPQADPDGRHVYFQSLDGPVRRDLQTGASTPIPRTPAGSGNRELSPDGRWFAFVRNGANQATVLSLMNTATGETRDVLTSAAPDRLWGWGTLAWTPDSTAVLVTKAGIEKGDARELWLAPVAGGAPRKLDVDVRGWRPYGIRLHPDGQHIAFFTGEDSREVWRLEHVLPAGTN